MHKLFFLCMLTIGLFACQPSPKEDKRVEELEIRLQATEAQLLNVKSELEKCKRQFETFSDSTSLDSIPAYQ